MIVPSVKRVRDIPSPDLRSDLPVTKLDPQGERQGCCQVCSPVHVLIVANGFDRYSSSQLVPLPCVDPCRALNIPPP